MPAAKRDLVIPSGGTVEFVVDVIGGPASLDGYVGALHIRELRDDPDTLAVVPPSGITVNGSTRQVTVRIPSATTSGYTWRRGVYDLRITGPSNDAWILVEGRVTNLNAITRGA